MREELGEHDGKPFRFYDLPPEAFPIDIEFIAQRTGEIVHTIHVDGPGALMVPRLSEKYGPVEVVMTFVGLNEVHRVSPQQ